MMLKYLFFLFNIFLLRIVGKFVFCSKNVFFIVTLLPQALNITTHVLRKGGTFVAKVGTVMENLLLLPLHS